MKINWTHFNPIETYLRTAITEMERGEPVGWVRIPSDSDRPTDFLFDHMVEQSRRISFGVWFPVFYKSNNREYAEMQEQLAASQARERQLREALGKCSAQLTRLGYSANHADEALSLHRDVFDPQPCALVSTNEIEYGRVVAEFDYMKLMAQRDDCVIKMQQLKKDAATEIESLQEQLATMTAERDNWKRDFNDCHEDYQSCAKLSTAS